MAERDSLRVLRLRTTATATIAVGLGLVVAATAMVWLLQRSLTSDVRASALTRAHTIAAALGSERPTPTVFSSNDEEFIQVLNEEGQVIASTMNLDGSPAVADLAPGESRRLDGLPFEDDPFLTVAAEGADGQRIVIVGLALERVLESTAAAMNLLTVMVPVLVLLVGLVTWLVTGRAMVPVEASRMRERRFISDASHELRSPVAAIREQAEVALRHPSSTDLVEFAGAVLEENLRLQRLAEDLLLLARLDEGTLALKKVHVDLDDLVFEAVKRVRSQSTLLFDTNQVSAARVAADKEQMETVVRNLTENALRHAREHIVIRLGTHDGEVVLTVDDDGEGVPEADRTRVFERFVRLDEARARDAGGSGLGLAIVAEVVAAHGGSVSLYESSLGGARLEVRLPSVS